MTLFLEKFTKESLIYALNKSGFQPIAMWCFGMDTIELLKFLRQNTRTFKNSVLEKILMSLVNSIQLSIDKQKLSDSMLMIAMKTDKNIPKKIL